MRKYCVIISEVAKQQLVQHIAFVANVNIEAAECLKNEIIQSIRELEELPERYPFINDIYIKPNKYHKLVVQHRYVILYQIKDYNVYVDYVLDSRSDYKWIIE